MNLWCRKLGHLERYCTVTCNYLFQNFVNSWTDDITSDSAHQGTGRNKLRTYRTYKSVYLTEHYLNCIMPHCYRRYECLPEELRTCFNCPNSVENQEYVLLRCSINSELREAMLTVLSEEFPDLSYMTARDQLSSLLCCKLNKSIRICAKTCFAILRTSRNIIYKQKYWRDVKYCVTTQNITGIPFIDQKNGFSFLQTLTYYTSFY